MYGGNRFLNSTKGEKYLYKYLYNNCKLCSKHFEDCIFYNYLRNRLKSDAKPTLFDIPNPPPKIGLKRRAIQKNTICIAPSGNYHTTFFFSKKGH